MSGSVIFEVGVPGTGMSEYTVTCDSPDCDNRFSGETEPSDPIEEPCPECGESTVVPWAEIKHE